MSAIPAKPARWRATAWSLIATLLLPTIAACTTAPGGAPAGVTPSRTSADVARLDGIVVDAGRVAQPREPGLAWFTRDGQRYEAYAGLELRRGDFIETGPRAHAVVRYPSGTELLLRPNSGGRIGSLTEFFGEVFVKVRGLFSVDTTFVTAGARGTAYLVRTYAGGTTGVTVVEGVVDVGSTTHAWPSLAIGAGTTTLAHPRPPQPMAANVDELRRTRDWVDRVERLAPPPAGVSHSGIIGAIAIGAVIAAILASGDKSAQPDRDRDRDRERERDRDRGERAPPPPPRPPPGSYEPPPPRPPR